MYLTSCEREKTHLNITIQELELSEKANITHKATVLLDVILLTMKILNKQVYFGCRLICICNVQKNRCFFYYSIVNKITPCDATKYPNVHDQKICPVESLICIQNKQTKCLKQVLFYGLMIYFSYIDYVYRNVLIVYPFFN